MRGNANDGAYITDAEYDLFEGDEGNITGNALFDLAHRYTMGQVAANWQEAHPGGSTLHSYTLSNRLQNVKERMTRETGRSKRELTQECQDAAETVGIKINGKATQQVIIPWPPRRPAPVVPPPLAVPPPTIGSSSTSSTTGPTVPLPSNSGGGLFSTSDTVEDPASDNSEGEDEDESAPVNAAATTTGEGDESERVEDENASGSTTAEPKGKNKKRSAADGGEEDDEEEGPRAKRAKTRESALAQQPSEADRGTGEASGSGGTPRREDVPIGGGYEAVKGDPTTISTLDEWREAKAGLDIITQPKDDVTRAPPLPVLSQQQYQDMGLEGTARNTKAEQKRLRETVLSFTPGEGKAAQAGPGVSKTAGDFQQEVDGEVVEGVEEQKESKNEDGGLKDDVEDGVIEESGAENEKENDA